MGLKCVAGSRTGSILLTLGLMMISAVGCHHDNPPMQSSAVADRFPVKSPPRGIGQHESEWPDDEVSDDLLGWIIGTTVIGVEETVSSIVDGTTNLSHRFSGDNASQAVRLLEDPTSPDNRRNGMNRLVDFGFLKQETPAQKSTAANFEKRCRQIAQLDADFTVRAAAIRTENRARDPRATYIFIKDLADANELVRLEAAKALANIPDPNAAPSLIAVMINAEETRDVRIAAADALKHYRTLPVKRALSSMLHDRSFAVAWQARRSLQALTQRDFRYDEAAWLEFFAGQEKAM